jgi:hypothetical protein
MGVLTGYLGAAPSLVWASGALAIVFAPVLVPVAVWIYTLVFAFSALWFAHYALAALQRYRAQIDSTAIVEGAPPGTRDAGIAEVVDVQPLPAPGPAGTTKLE